MTSTSQALLQSFIEGPLLVGDLPEADAFHHGDLSLPDSITELNLNQKLGHLCEDAFAALLESSPPFDLVAQNLQVQTDVHTTIGELDFLLRDLSNGQLIHLELATKFYLAVETEDGLTLPGPDARDNYFKKLQHLRDHQLRLTQKHRNTLPLHYRREPIVTRQLIYGCLFDHIHAATLAKPEFMNLHCRRGRWLTIDECINHFPEDTHFQIIPKPLWPVPLQLIQDIPLETLKPDRTINRCIMLRINQETVPYFVTPSNWPPPNSLS
jgi:hypothetical protein